MKQHKPDIKPIEEYLPQKIVELSGNSLCTRQLKSVKGIQDLKLKWAEKIEAIDKKTEDDFNEIEQNVKVFCKELKSSLKQQTSSFLKTVTEQLSAIEKKLEQYNCVVKEEGNYVFKEFIEILNNPNFDMSNVT